MRFGSKAGKTDRDDTGRTGSPRISEDEILAILGHDSKLLGENSKTAEEPGTQIGERHAEPLSSQTSAIQRSRMRVAGLPEVKRSGEPWYDGMGTLAIALMVGGTLGLILVAIPGLLHLAYQLVILLCAIGILAWGFRNM